MKKYLALSFLALILSGLIYSAQGPDFNLQFTRTVPSSLEANRISRNVSAPTRWPQWFHSLSEVVVHKQKAPNSSDIANSSQSIEKGDLLELKMDPNKGPWKKFSIQLLVSDFDPQQRITLKFLNDSSGKLSKIFDSLEWQIQWEDKDKGSIIKGTALAHTKSWRARLMGRVAEKILMNQVYYPNLVKLAELRQPFSVDLSPQAVGLTGPESAR